MIHELIQDGVLSNKLENFTIDNFTTFDIEVVQKKNEDKLLSPISIAVASTFSCDRYFERKSSQPKDGDIMIGEFMNYLVRIYSQYRET